MVKSELGFQIQISTRDQPPLGHRMPYNFLTLAEVLKDMDSTARWLQEQGLLPVARTCPLCGFDMKLYGVRERRKDQNGLGDFRCRNKHDISRSICG